MNSMNVSDRRRSTFLTDALLQAGIKKEIQKEQSKYQKVESVTKDEIQVLIPEPIQENNSQPVQRAKKVK
jgi:hypothetical protein